MASLAEFRKKYPQYGNRSDEELSGAMYRKFYADKMSREEFDRQIEYTPTQQGDDVNTTAPEPTPEPTPPPTDPEKDSALGTAADKGPLEPDVGRPQISLPEGIPPVQLRAPRPNYAVEPIDTEGRGLAERGFTLAAKDIRNRQLRDLELIDEIDRREAAGEGTFFARNKGSDLVRVYAAADPEKRQQIRDEMQTSLSREPAQAARDFGAGLDTLGGAIAQTPKQTLGSLAQMWRGGNVGTRSEEQDRWYQGIIDSAAQAADEFAKAGKPEDKDRTFVPGITQEDIRELPRNMGFSFVAMISGLGAGVGTSLGVAATGVGAPAAPAAGYVAGTGAAGVTAFRMSRDQFMVDLRDFYDAQSQQNRGKPMSSEEWARIRAKHETAADVYGLFEAVPEAAGEALSFGIIRGGGKVLMENPVMKNIMARTVVKFAGIMGLEQGTELLTSLGQQEVEFDVGLIDEKKSAGEILEDQAAQVALLTAVMSGGVGAASKGYDLATKQRNPLLKDFDPSGSDFEVEATRQAIASLDPKRGQSTVRLDTGSPEDVAASPLPNELIEDGQGALQSADDDQADNDFLAQNNLPKVGAKVKVSGGPGGITITGTMGKPYVVPATEFGEAVPGISITLDDGSTMDMPVGGLGPAGITIEPTDETIEKPTFTPPVAQTPPIKTEPPEEEGTPGADDGEFTPNPGSVAAPDDDPWGLQQGIDETFGKDPAPEPPFERAPEEPETPLEEPGGALQGLKNLFEPEAEQPAPAPNAPEIDPEGANNYQSFLAQQLRDAGGDPTGKTIKQLEAEIAAGPGATERPAEAPPAAPASGSTGQGGTESPAPGNVGQRRPEQAISEGFSEDLAKGETFSTILQAVKRAKELAPDAPVERKKIEEAVEAGVVMAARKIVARGNTAAETFDQLVDLYRRQPNLATRTSTSVEQQAYSTPVPLAFYASQRAGITEGLKVYEPTAGNGGLLISAADADITANELNPARVENLRMVFPGATVTEGNALEMSQRKWADVVVANPPFGKVLDDTAAAEEFEYDGKKTKQIDKAIAWNALETMKDDGTAVLIIGSERGTPLERTSKYRSKRNRDFFNALYRDYNVVEHITVDGKLYSRQGAQFPVDVITIKGRGPASIEKPMAGAPGIIGSWDQLKGVMNARSVDTAGQQRSGNSGAAKAPAKADEGAVRDRAGGKDQPSGGGRAKGSSGRSSGTGRTDRGADRTAAESRRGSGGEQRPAEGAGSGGPKVAGPETGGGTGPAERRDTGGLSEPAVPVDDDPYGLEAGIDETFGEEADGPVDFNDEETRRTSRPAIPTGPRSGAVQQDLLGGEPVPVEEIAERQFAEDEVARLREEGMTDFEIEEEALNELEDEFDDPDNLRRAQARLNALARERHRPIRSREERESTGALAKKAAKSTAAGASDALIGLSKLFGEGSNSLGSGPVFNEETWKKAKPLFISAVNEFYEAGMAIKEIGRRLIAKLQELTNMGREGIRNMMPYLTRFMQQVDKGDINLGQKEKAPPPPPTEQPDGDVEKRKRDNNEVASALSPQYEPFSNAAYAVGTLEPANMQRARIAALQRLKERVGDIDKFVASKLRLTLPELLGTEGATDNFYSAEQIDALALAIDNIDRGMGFIVGDQTGVGKGRIVASVLKYAMLEGHVPVFITQKAALYKDMIRDLRDIGMGKSTNRADISERIFVTNNNLRDGPKKKDALVLDPLNPEDKLESLPPAAQKRAIEHIANEGRLPDEYDMLFTTYSQLRFEGGKDQARITALRSVAANAVFVMDESHEAAGTETKRRDPETGEELPSTADLIREIIGVSKGVLYSSATYAKNPHAMSLYYMTAMGVSMPMDQLADAIAAGGVPLQQVVANMLVDSGQYVRRERSYDGVTVNANQLEVDKVAAQETSNALRAVFELDRDYMTAVREAYIEEIASEGGGQVGTDQAIGDTSASGNTFSSIMHNVISQALLALKAPAAVDMAIEAHRRGEKPLITLSNTNEAIIADHIESEGLSKGDPVSISFNVIIRRYVDRLRRIKIEDSEGNKRYVMITDADIARLGDPGALPEMKRVESYIDNIDLSALPASPIDYIYDRLTAEGLNVGEITGRGVTIAGGIVADRDTSIASKARAVDDFNGGNYDVLILNRSGSTGLSMHALERPGNDGKVRHMIVLQPDSNIDVFMQLFGRIHRTGQSQLPIYTIAISDLVVERRSTALLMQKLASLSANTTANTESPLDIGNVVNFINKYGDRVVRNYLRENEDVASMLDLGTVFVEGLARKFTGRLAIIDPDAVEAIYESVEANYKDVIEALDAAGMNDLEAKTLDLQAEQVSFEEIVPANMAVEPTPFSQSAIIETMNVRRLGKPYTMDQIDRRLEKILGVDENAGNPDIRRAKEELITERQEKIREMLPLAIARAEENLEIARRALAEAKTDVQKEKAEARVRLWSEKRSDIESQTNSNVEMIRTFAPGNMMVLSFVEGEQTVRLHAVSFGVSIKGVRNNPQAPSAYSIRFAINEATPEIPVSLSSIVGEDATVSWEPVSRQVLEQAFEIGQVEQREQRQIITGNLLGGYAQFKKGTIIMFTRNDGYLDQGVMLPRDFDLATSMRAKPAVFENPEHIIQFLAESERRLVATSDGKLNIVRGEGGGYLIRVAASGGKPYYLNKQVRGLIRGGDFVRQGRTGPFKADVRNAEDLKTIVGIYQDNLGAEFQTTSFKDEARLITGAKIYSGEERKQSRGSTPINQTPELAERLQEIREDLTKRLTALGIDQQVTLELVNSLGSGIMGDYGDGLIRLALDRDSPLKDTLNHEVIHFLREKGFFTEEEWFILEENARASRLRTIETRLRYSGLGMTEEEILEEFIAEQFADREREKPTDPVEKIYRKIVDLIKAIARSFRRSQYEMADQVFRDIANGTIGSRKVGGRDAATTAFHAAAAAQMARTHNGLEPLPARKQARSRGRRGSLPDQKPEEIRRSMFPFLPREMQQQFDDAKKGAGDTRGIITRAKDFAVVVTRGFSRHYIDLPNTPQFSNVKEQLRKVEAAPTAARQQTVRVLMDILDGFNRADYEVFSWKVLIDDLSWERDQEHELPFGITYDQLDQMKAAVDAKITPKIRDAVRARQAIVQQVAAQMVRSGVLSAEQARNPSYYRHQVLDYARAWVQYDRLTSSSQFLRGKKRVETPHWAKRLGSSKAINLNLLEAEFEWMTRALVDVNTADVLEGIKESDHNIREDLLSQARAYNRDAVERKIAGDKVLEDKWKLYSQRIAYGLQGVADALQSLTVPPHLQDAADAVINGTADDEIFPLLSWIVETGGPGSMSAATVFNAINHRRMFVKETLGRDYANTRDIDSLIERFSDPKKYASFQPDGGNMLLYTVQTLPQHAIDTFMNKVLSQAAGATPDVLQALREELEGEVKDVLAVGGERYKMVLPIELARTLERLSDVRTESLLDVLTETPMRMWKKWVLINPRRIFRYNLNNMSGDLDAVIAGNPRALKKMPQAIKELYQVMFQHKEPSLRYKEAVWRGVFDSGLTVQEISEINELESFKNIIDQRGTMGIKQIMQIWRGMQRVTWFRENWLRYAAYLDYVEQLEAGRPMSKVGYGAAKPSMVDAVEDTKDRAALLARELVGDYGNVSYFGQEIRRKLIPFWSWMEINTKRYWRMAGNGFNQGILSGTARAGFVPLMYGTRKTVWLFSRMALMYGAIQLWNNLFFDDEEDDLDEITRSRLHLNLGRDADGRVRVLRFNGALGDVLDWVGWGDVSFMASEVEKGRASWGDVLGALVKAPVNKVLNGLTPVLKMPAELISGRSWYPDVFKPRKIRDGERHLAQMFSLEHEYDLLMGKPSRGYGASWLAAFIDQRDPGEAAYNEIRTKAYDWVARTKGTSFEGAFTPRANAMYEWRTAQRYGDEEAADRAFKKMKELGVTYKQRQRMKERAHPLGTMSNSDRRAFLRSLDYEDRRRLREAEKWYDETFR